MVYKILLIQVFQWLLNIGANARCSPERIKLSSHWSPHGTPLMKKTTSSAQLLHVETGFWEAPFEPTFAVSFAAAVETTALNKLWLWRQMLMLKWEVTADKQILTQNFLLNTHKPFTDDIDFVTEVRQIQQALNQISTWKCERMCCLVTFGKPCMET